MTMRSAPLVDLLLQKGLSAFQHGNLTAAQAAFDQLLQQQPGHGPALLLAAEIAQAQGAAAAAEMLLTRAAHAQPAEAKAWFRLGEVHEERGALAQAQACFARCIELRPQHVHALYNQARLLRALGQRAEAEQCLVQALRLQPVAADLRAQMLQLQALLQDDDGRLGAALATLDLAIDIAPKHAALHHNRGVLLQRLARHGDALAAYERAFALGLDAADAHYNRGNCLQSLGRLNEALATYLTALAREPQHALALYDIARLRWRLGDAAFTQDLDAAAAQAPASALAPGIKGRLLLRAGRDAEAALAFADAVRLDGSAAGYADGLGQALSRLGRLDEALAAHRRAVDLAPNHAATHISYAASLLRAGQFEHAAQEAEMAVRLDPLDQQAWAQLGLAWRANGHHGDAWLNDYQQYIQVFDLAAPAGWANVQSFNQALAAALQSLHTDAHAPIDQTLRHGSQTLGNIFDQHHPLIDQLKAQLAAAVDSYIAYLAALPPNDDHPLLARISPRWAFTDSWSSRLRDGGFHTNHVHSHGWISSCYYVALPQSVMATDDAGNIGRRHAGWISFGTPDISVPGCDMTQPRRAEQPRVGRLILFPSYMWHGTVPFTDSQPRLTVAFDVMPAD